MDQQPYNSSQHFSHPIQPQPSPQLYPQPYYPPQQPKRLGTGWLVATLILLFIGMPHVGYWAYQAGYQSGRSTLPPGTAPAPTAQPGQPTMQPAPTGNWTDVMKWSDSVDQQTVVFTMPAEWRIV